MRFETAAALVAAAMLLQGCGTGRDGDWGMEGGGHGGDHGGGRGDHGGGKPGPFVNLQHLKPVEIKNVQPRADPKQRFSLAVCDQAKCNLTVNVDASCNITLDPQYMGLRFANPSMDFALVYTLVSQNGHQFEPTTPIVFKKLVGNAPPVHVDSQTQVTVSYKNVQQARRFLYGIVVSDSKGTQCGVLDPGVIPDL